MCDTELHFRLDDLLLAPRILQTLPPTIVLDLIRAHPYGDECCRLQPHRDGPPSLRPGEERWGISEQGLQMEAWGLEAPPADSQPPE